MRNALFLLLMMAPVLSGDPYSATDCGQPGSELYAGCQALFPPIVDSAAPDISKLGYDPDRPPAVGGMSGWIYQPLTASPDGSWVAAVITLPSGDGVVDLWHAGAWGNVNLLINVLAPFGWGGVFVSEVTNNGLLLGTGDCEGEFGGGPGQFVGQFGCVPYDLQAQAANSLADGGIGTFLAINEAGQIFQQGGKYDWTVLSPPGVPTPVPEPGSWIILAGGVGMAISLRRLAMKSRCPRGSLG